MTGEMKSYVRCTNIDYESAHDESFYDIQLRVRNVRDCEFALVRRQQFAHMRLSVVRKAFEMYITEDVLDGDNKYDAGPVHGMQDARKGIIFTKLPPVLHLQVR